jgi:hypothetical protein
LVVIEKLECGCGQDLKLGSLDVFPLAELQEVLLGLLEAQLLNRLVVDDYAIPSERV